MTKGVSHYWLVTASVAMVATLLVVGGCDSKPRDAAEPPAAPPAQAGDEVESSVKKIVGERLGVDVKRLKLSDRFAEDLGADELDAVELVMELEEAFDLFIPDEVWEKMMSIKDVVDYIRKHRKTNEKHVDPPDQPKN